MKLYEAWQNLLESFTENQQQMEFWNAYYATETELYKKILAEKRFALNGKAAEIAQSFDVEPTLLAGFLDGANSSFETPVALDELEEDTELAVQFNIEKLYYNMHEARAKWLYSLKEWDDVLSEQKRKEILFQWRADHTAVSAKVGKNDPCPCGSGKKYKNCCG